MGTTNVIRAVPQSDASHADDVELSDAQWAALRLLDDHTGPAVEYEICSRDVALKLARLGLVRRFVHAPKRTRLSITEAGRDALRGAR